MVHDPVGLTEKQIKSRASRRGGMLLMVTYGAVFLLGLIAFIVCLNVFALTSDQQTECVVGLIFAPIVPALVVSGAYYTKATWDVISDEDDDEEKD